MRAFASLTLSSSLLLATCALAGCSSTSTDSPTPIDAGATPGPADSGAQTHDAAADAHAELPIADAGDAGTTTPDAAAPDASADASAPSTIVIDEGFDAESALYKAVFADYPAGSETFYELKSGVQAMPAPLAGSGYMLSGINHSDDLWMSVSRSLSTADGIVAGASYDVDFTAWIASNAQTGCIGVGGAPGESVYVKGDVVDHAPASVAGTPNLSFSVDKGNQGNVGPEALGLGDLANGEDCGSVAESYKLLEKHATSTTPVKADASGHLWVYVGTDSGYEALTTVYIDRIKLTLTPH